MKKICMTLVATFALTSCGKQTFDVVQSQAQSDAPGSINIPSKVDILLAVDDSGSTAEIQNQLQSALAGFTSSLESQKWDWRLAATSLTVKRSIDQVAASHYDSNWGASWVSPYPGAPQVSSLPSSLFRMISNFGAIPPLRSSTAEEPGLSLIGQVLGESVAQNYFIRKDALLVIVAISNGQDSSDGVSNYYPYAANTTVSSGILNAIKNVKGAALASTVRFYAAVNTVANGRSCLGGSSWMGSRYMSVAGSLGGKSYDLCSGQSLSSTLSDLGNDLQGQRLNFITHYIFIDKEPNPATIHVFKNLVDGSKIEVPASNGSTPGWRYIGYRSNFASITDPVAMNPKTGYAIELIGSYQLNGQETATIEYLPAGVQPSN